MANKKRDLYRYQPVNPSDSKIPSLIQEPREEPTPKFESSNFQTQSVESTSAKESARDIIARLKQRSQGAKQENRDAKITHIPRFAPEDVIDPDAEQFDVASNVVMPDPNSSMAFNLRSYNKNASAEIEKLYDVRGKISRLQGDVRANLKVSDIDLIVNKYKHKVIKITKKVIVLKHTKFGYEIYKNNNDNNWWVVAIKFEEPFSPKDSKYITLWSGSTFIGYGLPTLKDCLEKTDQLMVSGRTGDIAVRDYVVAWKQDKNRFLAGEEPVSFSWKEYQKIVKWYKENKIRIHVKEERIKDYEDLMEEVKLKKSRGEAVSPMVALQAKLLETPRKAINIFGYPVENPDQTREDIVKAENKLYQIAFAFTE